MHVMNPRTTVYLLFREYVDSQKATSRPYIHGKEYDLGELKTEILSEVQPILSVLKFFGYERLIVLYDRKNLEALLYPAKTLHDEYPDLSTAVLAQIKDKYTSWDDNKMEPDNLTYTLETGFDISYDMLGDMARRQHQQMSPCALLQNDVVYTDKDGCIAIACSDKTIMQLPTFYEVKGFHAWISENRMPQRIYHYNKKHGDANREGWKRASQLLTDEATTKELLKYAVGVDKESALWYYDARNDCFIYFENEGDTPQLGFHAYHINKGDENFDNIDIEKLCQVQSDVQKLFRL